MFKGVAETAIGTRGLEKPASTSNLVVMKSAAVDIYIEVPTGAPDLSTQHRAIHLTSHWGWIQLCKHRFLVQ